MGIRKVLGLGNGGSDSHVCLELERLERRILLDVSFAGAVNYDVGGAPRVVVAEDFNGDGDEDLAVVNYGSYEYSIVLGNGDGTFAAAVNDGITGFRGERLVDIAAADFDGDGDVDLALVWDIESIVIVMLGNGDGTFTFDDLYWPSPYADSPRGTSIAAADFDGDGNVDLAVTDSWFGSVNFLKGGGDGTFDRVGAFEYEYRAQCLRPADLDGDGDVDLAIGGAFGGSIKVLLNEGDWAFADPVSYDTAYDPDSIAAADFDGDGDLDLAVTSRNSLSILPGNGDGTFGDHDVYYAGEHYVTLIYGLPACGHRVATADLDGDGKLDVAVADYGSDEVSILLGRGDGTFAGAVSLPAGDGPYAVAAADFDADGDVDLVTGQL